MTREFDLVIWGATGFTGSLVVEYLVKTYGVSGDLRWAIAGRSREKLEQIRSAWLVDQERDLLPIVIADSNDAASLAAMAARTRVICTTVGPYARYGSELLAACVTAGTHYCDLTGEVQWLAKMIPLHQTSARASGALIVHCCGFDSIPSDMGCWFLQQAMVERHGVPASRVKARVGRNRGSASGGTIASMLDMMEQASHDKTVRDALRDPYSLCPQGTTGDDGADQATARFDSDFKQWTSPFVMAAINGRVVRRSNALLDFPWGRDFRYDEAVLCRSRGEALRNTLGLGALMLATATGPGRALARRLLPAPGEGPDREAREAGHFELFFHGVHPGDRSLDLRARVAGKLDPGYGSTSRMLGETAVCLAMDPMTVAGGCWTPAAALGPQLLPRLRERSGLSFEIVEIS